MDNNKPVQRDANGRILKGASLNPSGRPKKESGTYKGKIGRQVKLTELIMTKASEIDEETGKSRLELLVEKLFEDAIVRGSTQAVEIILTRAFGKPVDRVQLTQETEIDFSKYSIEELETLNDIAKRHSEFDTDTKEIMQ